MKIGEKRSDFVIVVLICIYATSTLFKRFKQLFRGHRFMVTGDQLAAVYAPQFICLHGSWATAINQHSRKSIKLIGPATSSDCSPFGITIVINVCRCALLFNYLIEDIPVIRSDLDTQLSKNRPVLEDSNVPNSEVRINIFAIQFTVKD